MSRNARHAASSPSLSRKAAGGPRPPAVCSGKDHHASSHPSRAATGRRPGHRRRHRHHPQPRPPRRRPTTSVPAGWSASSPTGSCTTTSTTSTTTASPPMSPSAWTRRAATARPSGRSPTPSPPTSTAGPPAPTSACPRTSTPARWPRPIVLAQAAGEDPRAFGGVDLVARLEVAGQRRVAHGRAGSRTTARPTTPTPSARPSRSPGSPAAGSPERRVPLCASCCSSSATRAGSGSTSPRRRCVEQGCDVRPPRRPQPDTDVTAFAVLALDALPKQGKRVRPPPPRQRDRLAGPHPEAERLLRRRRRAPRKSNANSTGLAAWALGEAGACSAARDGGRVGAGTQVVGDLTGTPFAGEKGAIAYDRAAYKPGRQDGITTADPRPVAPDLRPGRCPHSASSPAADVNRPLRLAGRDRAGRGSGADRLRRRRTPSPARAPPA